MSDFDDAFAQADFLQNDVADVSHILDGLNEAQREAVTVGDRHVLAGPRECVPLFVLKLLSRYSSIVFPYFTRARYQTSACWPG